MSIWDVASGVLNFFGQKEANEQNIAMQRETNQRNWDQSLFMANNSINMRKQDAERSGIHPVFALGAPTMSFAPAQVGAPAQNALGGLGQSMRSLGQTLTSPQPKEAVPNAYSTQAAALDLENRRLQNEILKNRVLSDRAQVAGMAPGPFPVPESGKPAERPPLMMDGQRWNTSSTTSPMKAWEDQYGDEGPVAWGMPLAILMNDMMKNYGPVASWPGQVLRHGASAVKQDVMNEAQNAQRFFRPVFSPPDSNFGRWHKPVRR